MVQKQEKRKSRSKVYWKMFLSYLLMLFIPIFAASLIYSYTLRIIQGQAERMNRSLLESVKMDFDKEIENIQETVGRLSLDRELQLVSQAKGKLSGYDQQLLYYLYKNLETTGIAKDFISDVFVCFNNSGKVSSSRGNMDLELYYQMYYEGGSRSLEEFKEYMEEYHYNDIDYLERGDGSGVLLFSSSSLTSVIGKSAATICAAVEVDQLQEKLRANKWDESVGLFFVSSGGIGIGTDDRSLEDWGLSYKELEAGDTRLSLPSAGDSMVQVLSAVHPDWSYVMVTPLSVVNGEAARIQRVSLIGLFVCIAVGFGSSAYIAKKNYNPLKAILGIFHQHGNFDIGEEDNEYQWLSRKIELFFQESVDTKRVLKENKKQLRRFYLMKLLQEPYNRKQLEQHGIFLEGEAFAVVLLYPDPRGRQAAEGGEEQEERALQRFVIMNIFEELCLKHFKVEMLEMGERAAAIISLPSMDSSWEEILIEQAEELSQLTERSFGFRTVVLIGPVCSRLEEIQNSYLQTCGLEEYVNLLDETIICYREVMDIQPQYDYSFETEEKLINAIQAGELEQARSCMQEVFDRNLKGKVAVNIYHCLVYDMVGTLLKGASQGGYKEAARELRLPDADVRKLPVEEIKARFMDCLEQICTEISRKKQETAQDNSYSRKIEAYIRENFRDPDLNISITSQHFDITPTYLSAVYKKQTGRSLLEYINTLRIQYAEGLLEQGATVVEAAEQSGFRDSGGFIRTFKKKKGITPGQLKKKI